MIGVGGISVSFLCLQSVLFSQHAMSIISLFLGLCSTYISVNHEY